MGSLATEKKKMGNSLGHKVQSTLGGFRPRFKIKNNTQREIFVKLTLEKIDLPVKNITPGWLENPTPDSTRKRDKAARLVDKFGSLMKIAVAEKADEQRNNVVFDIFPKEHGFKEVFPGESYKSHKKWKMLKGFKGAAYLTVLTRESSSRMCLQEKEDAGLTTIQWTARLTMCRFTIRSWGHCIRRRRSS